MFRTIACSEIDFDNTYFLMSYPLASKRLIESVGTIGVLQPIIVSRCCCGGLYQIITGFRRVYACREVGVEMVNAYIYPVEPENMLSAFSLAFYENASHRTFNDIEKALILTKLLDQFQCPREEVIRFYMPLLQLSPNEKVLKTYLQIVHFEEPIKQYLAFHDLPMTVLDLLANLQPDDCQAVFTLIATLKLGINKIKELLTDLEEIALRDHCAIRSILDDARIHEMLKQEKFSGPQKAEHIRQIIRAKRYPQLTALEQEYHERLKRLRVPQGVRLQTDRFFEDNDLSVTFHFQTPEQLRNVAEELLKLSQRTELQQVLNLVQGKDIE